MPIYEYECRACGEELEILQKFSEGSLRKCPSCGELKLHRKISRSAFHLKGDGWYVTDYGGKNGEKKKESTSDSTAKTEAKSETKTSSANDSSTSSKPESKKTTSKESGS